MAFSLLFALDKAASVPRRMVGFERRSVHSILRLSTAAMPYTALDLRTCSTAFYAGGLAFGRDPLWPLAFGIAFSGGLRGCNELAFRLESRARAWSSRTGCRRACVPGQPLRCVFLVAPQCAEPIAKGFAAWILSSQDAPCAFNQ